jgi:hypothetical protein
MSEEIRAEMMEAYFDGGVSRHQLAELGEERPDIARFLSFSSEFEGVPFRALWTFGGLEYVSNYVKEFEKIAIDGAILASCMDGNSDAIRTVCRQVLVSIDEASRLRETGETQLVSRGRAVSLTAVKAFILAVFDAKERYQVDEIIPELYYLMSLILFPGQPEAMAANASNELQGRSAYFAWAYRHKHKKLPSYRRIAKQFNVAPSTISRLFKNHDEFDALVGLYESIAGDQVDLAKLEKIFPNL